MKNVKSTFSVSFFLKRNAQKELLYYGFIAALVSKLKLKIFNKNNVVKYKKTMCPTLFLRCPNHKKIYA
jgi:hypothetical protein